MTRIAIRPTSQKARKLVNVDVWCVDVFDPDGSPAKVVLTTVDSAGTEVGFTTNVNRPTDDLTLLVGIKAPPKTGPGKVRAYQLGKLVAEVPLTVTK